MRHFFAALTVLATVATGTSVGSGSPAPTMDRGYLTASRHQDAWNQPGAASGQYSGGVLVWRHSNMEVAPIRLRERTGKRTAGQP